VREDGNCVEDRKSAVPQWPKSVMGKTMARNSQGDVSLSEAAVMMHAIVSMIHSPPM
jgi:hypothetical protein